LGPEKEPEGPHPRSFMDGALGKGDTGKQEMEDPERMKAVPHGLLDLSPFTSLLRLQKEKTRSLLCSLALAGNLQCSLMYVHIWNSGLPPRDSLCDPGKVTIPL
jgi:hypothetical protein